MEVIEEIPKPKGVPERFVKIRAKNRNWTQLYRIFANLNECRCVIPTFRTSTSVPICPGNPSNLKPLTMLVKKFLWPLHRRESPITMTTRAVVPVAIRSHPRCQRKSGNHPLKISLKTNNQERSQPMITYSYPIFQHSR